MDPKLVQLLIQHFCTQGRCDLKEANAATDFLIATALNVAVKPTHAMDDAQCYLALSMGGRLNRWKNLEHPGPQNQQIAKALCSCYEARRNSHKEADPFCLHVCVQWEIVLESELESVIPADQLHILQPDLHNIYPTHLPYPTQKLLRDMQTILLKKGIDITRVPVGFFAHFTHLPRVVSYGENMGITKFAAPLADLPSDFDKDSALKYGSDFRGIWASNAISAMVMKRNLLYGMNVD